VGTINQEEKEVITEIIEEKEGITETIEEMEEITEEKGEITEEAIITEKTKEEKKNKTIKDLMLKMMVISLN